MWGAEVSGVEGHVGAPLKFRQETWNLICRVVKFGFCSKKILQKILFHFSIQARALQFATPYLQICPGVAYKWVAPIPGFILDELRSIGLHPGFAVWDMRRPLSETLVSTDATEAGQRVQW